MSSAHETGPPAAIPASLSTAKRAAMAAVWVALRECSTRKGRPLVLGRDPEKDRCGEMNECVTRGSVWGWVFQERF